MIQFLIPFYFSCSSDSSLPLFLFCQPSDVATIDRLCAPLVEFLFALSAAATAASRLPPLFVLCGDGPRSCPHAATKRSPPGPNAARGAVRSLFDRLGRPAVDVPLHLDQLSPVQLAELGKQFRPFATHRSLLPRNGRGAPAHSARLPPSACHHCAGRARCGLAALEGERHSPARQPSALCREQR